MVMGPGIWLISHFPVNTASGGRRMPRFVEMGTLWFYTTFQKRTMCFHNLSSVLPWKGRNPDPFEQTLIPSTQRGVLPSLIDPVPEKKMKMWKVYNINVNNDDENDDEDRQGTTTIRKVHLRHETTAYLVLLLHWRETEKNHPKQEEL